MTLPKTKTIHILLASTLLCVIVHTATAQNQPPPAPMGLSPTAITSESFLANWTTSEKNLMVILSVAKDVDFKDLVPGYESKTAWGNDIMFPTIGYPVTGLESDTWYYYRLRAYRIYEPFGSMFSSIMTAKTAFSPVPVTVTILPKTEMTQNSLRIYWNRVAKATQYNIEVSTSSTFATGSIISLQTDSTAITVSRLLPQTKYYFRVRGINAQGVGNFSFPQSAQTITALGYILRQVPKSFTFEGNTPKTDRLYFVSCSSSGSFDAVASELVFEFLDSLTKNGICIKRTWIRPSLIDCITKRPNNELTYISGNSPKSNIIVELCENDERITKYSCFRQGGSPNFVSNCENDEFYYYALNMPVSVRETEINTSSLPQFACLYGSISSEIQIQCRLGQRIGILGIELFDVLGRKVYTSEQNVVNGESNISIPTSQIAQGMYFARCVFQSGMERHIQTLPLVIQH